VLERAGYQVVLAGLDCCGRALASKGFLTESRQLAQLNIARLLPWAEQGLPIVGCEPSCLLMLVDEYPDLVPGEAAQTVAGRAALIDSFLAQQGAELPVSRSESNVLLHGHCHQKALVGLRDTQQVLRSAASAVHTVDSGCCGMAGSFGYEHYDTSIAIGERVLFKAVREAAHDEIIAPGFSCRQQILHGTGRKALHPIEFLARQLG
jgi:Fe-S oxidoreductase